MTKTTPRPPATAKKLPSQHVRKDELVPGNPSPLFLHAILAIFWDDECCGDGNRKAPIYLRPSLQKDAAAAYSMVATWLSKYGHLPCSESAIASIAWPHLPSSLSSSQQGPQLRRSNPLRAPSTVSIGDRTAPVRPPLLCIWPPSRSVRWIFDRTAPGLCGSLALRTLRVRGPRLVCVVGLRIGRLSKQLALVVSNSDAPVKESNVIFRSNLTRVISTFAGTVDNFVLALKRSVHWNDGHSSWTRGALALWTLSVSGPRLVWVVGLRIGRLSKP